MPKREKSIAYCGLYCAECPLHVGKIADLARDLRKELRAIRFEKLAASLAKIPFFREFKDYTAAYSALGGLVRMRCAKVCKDGGGPPFCKIRKCCIKNKIPGCWVCTEFEKCMTLDFLKGGHGDAHIKNLRTLNKKGVPAFLAGKKCWYSKIV